MVGQPRSLMELERKNGTSHDCLELAMFSKLVVKYPTQFFFLLLTGSSSQFCLFSPKLSLICLLQFSPLPIFASGLQRLNHLTPF